MNKVIFVTTALLFGVSAFAGDGAKNSTIIVDNEANKSIAVQGEVKVAGFTATTNKTQKEEANAGSVSVKGSMENSTVVVKNKSKDTAVAVGAGSNAGSVKIDATNK